MEYSLLGTIIVVLDIIALVSIFLSRDTVGHKVLWALLVLIFPVIGMILYYVLGRTPQSA